MTAFPVYASDPSAAVLHPAGRARFAPGKRCTRLPVLDPSTGLDARLSMDDAETTAARLGGRLPTDEEWRAIALVAHFIPPVIVRETGEELADRVRRLGGDALERMATVEWARREDEGYRAELARSGWDGDAIVLNAGKAKVARTDAERALEENINDGWQTHAHSTEFIQPRSWAHRGKDSQRDYSEKTWVVFDDPSDPPSDPPFHPSLLASIWAGVTDFVKGELT